MNKLKRRIVLLPVALLAACAAGPEYRAPALPAVAQFARAEAGSAVLAPMANAEFWQAFQDGQLSTLVAQALAANNDLRLALARSERETALLREAKSGRYPAASMSASAAHQKQSVDQAYGLDRSNDVVAASVQVRWELDLFGKVRRDVEAHRAEAAALVEDLKALQVIIVGRVASAYMDLRGTQERLRVTRASIVKHRDTLDIIRARQEAGRSSDFDVARARAQYQAASARVYTLEARIAVDQHRLAVLTGRPPEALIAELDQPGALPALPAMIYPETPAVVLRRRPDIAAAEQRLHAATARIGVATADLFPQVSLAGSLGSYALHAGDLWTQQRSTSLLGLGIDWSFLDAGRVRARIAASDAAAAGLLSTYQQTVLLALEDTENALIRYARLRTEDEHLEQASMASSHAAQLAREQLRAGTIGVYEVLDAEREQLRAQDDYAEGRTRSALAAVALYQELAGGWPQYTPTSVALATGGR